MGYNNTVPMSEANAKAVYQILVEECGANVNDPIGFISEFSSDDPCREWRFQGSLGFGGKFRYPYMTVDCYREDETDKRLKCIDAANKRLAELKLEIAKKSATGEKNDQ